MAKVYLDSGDNFTLSSAATVYGSTGTEKVVVNSGVTGITIDASVERVDLSGASSAYTFKQAGNTLQVYSGTTLVATTTVQDDTNGSQLVFSNGSVDVKMATGGTMTLGGATVSSSAAAAVTPTTIDTATTSGSGTGGSGGSGGTTTAQTLVLGTGIDVPATGSGDDVIVGDFGGTTPTLNAGDQIAGGAGTDTLKMYGLTKALLASNMPVSITSIEKFEFVNGPDDNHIDLSNYTMATTGLTNVVFGNVATMSGKTITTTTGQSLSLATGAGSVATVGAVTWAGAATDATLNLTLNGYQGGTGVTPVALTVTGASATTQNIASTGAANGVSTLTLGAVTNKVAVTGDKALTVTTDLVSSGGATILKTVDASANTGGVSIKLAAATNAAFAFTGGSGTDTITFADDGLAALTSGAQLNGGDGTSDKIGIFDTALTVTETARINQATNFEVLGLNAAITLDGSTLTSIKKYSLDASAAQVISNMATGGEVAITAAHAANVTLGAAVGVTDVKITVGTPISAGLTVGGDLTVGHTAVSLVSQGAGGTNTITNLKNADNSVYTITGSSNLTIGTTQATTTGSKYDGSAATGVLTINGNTTAYAADSALADVIIGGSGADVLKASVNGATLTGNGGNDTFNVEVAVAAATTKMAITKITDFTKGDKIDFGATAGAFTTTKVDLSAAATEAAAIDLLVAGNNSDLKWGNYNGYTYVADDVGAGATVATTDTIVKITGTLDLSTSTLAATVLTYA